MDVTVVALVLLAVMVVLLASGLWVAVSLMGVGLFGLLLFASVPAGKVMATTVWGGSDSWALTALPLFIWMAEILFRTRMSDDIFNGLAPWLTRIPGRLIHVNIVGCGIFSAVSGSNAATCATVAKIALPELMRRGYDERMVIGSLTGVGHARDPDPAVDHDDRLRLRRPGLDRPALHRRLHPRLPHHGALHGLRDALGLAAPGEDAAGRHRG